MQNIGLSIPQSIKMETDAHRQRCAPFYKVTNHLDSFIVLHWFWELPRLIDWIEVTAFVGRHFIRTSLPLGEHAVLGDGRWFGLVRGPHHAPQQTVAKLGQTDVGLANTAAQLTETLYTTRCKCGWKQHAALLLANSLFRGCPKQAK